MPKFLHVALATVLAFSLITQSGCAGRFLEGDIIHAEAKIRSTPENVDVMHLVDTYRQAMEAVDVDMLRSLISQDYYENAGTTNTTDDDYGHEGLESIFNILTQHVKEARLNVKIRDIRVYDDRADVVFEYAYTMLYQVGDTKRWQTERDVNRIQLHREDDAWLIVSGL